MIENKCKNCDFWVRKEDTKLGLCRRYPPTLNTHLIPRPMKGVIGGSQQVSLEPVDTINWPTTREDDFCGEFKND